MSFKRKMKSAYKTKPPRGPNGEKLCRWCKIQIQPPKRTFCSPECVHEWQLRTNPGYMRKCVKKRDKQICAICKINCKELQARLITLYKQSEEECYKELERLRIPKHRLFGSLWDADHLVPVCEGGGETGLDNIRTLCVPCHRAETNKLLTRKAKKDT